MKLLFAFLSVLFFLLIVSCDTIEPPNNKALTLKLEDVSCTEACIQFASTNIQIPSNLTLLINDQAKKTINLTTADTLLHIDSLLPNQNYSFQVSSISSNKVTATTLDTTSHNFTWQTFTFGEVGAGSSTLYDVAIIDENNIWAVGEIYMNDSLGNPDPNAYNAIYWNGVEWNPRKINVLFRGKSITPPLEGVFAFSSNDIWFVGSLPIHGDGEDWEIYDLRTMVDPNISLSKAWGSNSNNMYFVGRNGSIAHYGGPSVGWQKIESGTTTNIDDIWGFYDKLQNNKTILCAVSNRVTAGDYKILKINNNNSIDSVKWNTNRRVQSIWFEDNLKLFVCGGGVFINNINNVWQEQPDVPLISTNRIRGIAKNDIFVGGDFGLLTHYNGLSWKVYPEANVALFYSLDYKNSALIAVGERNGKAVILEGKK
jgi:hypothetical protein